MKTNCTLVLLFSLFYSGLFAQNSLEGIVKDGKNEGIFFATIALYERNDSTLVAAESTDENGFFNIKKIKDGHYYVQVSMLGYQDFVQNDLIFPRDNGKKINVSLQEDASTLETVEVTAKVPLLEQKSDRLVVNVENNITGMNNNVLDVMKKVPGVIVTNDKIRLAGSTNPTILINGKTTKYMDMESLLKDMPGDNIKKVEVIHQPGAEFPAEGSGPIINIVLKKNSLFGTNGSVRAGVGRGKADWKYNGSVALSHYQGNVNINAGAGYRNSPFYDRMRITRNVDGDIYDQVSVDPQYSESVRGNLSLDWNITDKHKTGFSSRIYNSMTDNIIENTTDIRFKAENIEDITLYSTNHQDETWRFWAVNPYYTFEIDTAGQKLDFDVNIVGIKNDGASTLSAAPESANLGFLGQQYLQPGTSQIFTTQLDYTYPFSDALKVQVGGKYSDAHLDNDLTALDETEQGDWVENPFQSNHFIFDEDIKAAYTKLTYGKNKWSGTLGLRYEDSHSVGYSVTIDSTLTRDIEKFFPSASIGREITDQLGATLAYSYRISRPRYSNLNPFVYYLDPFTSRQGNPSLAPALTHSMKFTLSFEKQPFFNIAYRTTEGAMIDITDQDDDSGEASLSTVNLDSYENLNIQLFFPLDFIPKISGYGGIIANNNIYKSEYLGASFDRSKWDFTGFLSAEFTLPGKIQSEISGWYNSGGIEGIMQSQWLCGVDVGFSKKILNDKAKISFGVENIVAQYLTANIEYENMDLLIQDRWDGPVVNMQFSYRFGNQHMKSSSRRDSSASDEINRAQKD